MKAALLKGKLDISVEEVPLPEIGDDEILLKVKAASKMCIRDRISPCLNLHDIMKFR